VNVSSGTGSPVGAVKTVRPLRNGDFLLEVTSAVQSRIVNKLDKWVAGCPVTASPHRTLNTCKGVIRCAPLVDCDKDQTLKELKSQGVSDITNITVKHDSGSRRNTNTFINTFKAPAIPKYLHVGYLRVRVSMYIPNPLRWFKCQKFGHGKNACRGREICATCGQIGHTSNDCTNEPKCPNCTGNHTVLTTRSLKLNKTRLCALETIIAEQPMVIRHHEWLRENKSSILRLSLLDIQSLALHTCDINNSVYLDRCDVAMYTEMRLDEDVLPLPFTHHIRRSFTPVHHRNTATLQVLPSL